MNGEKQNEKKWRHAWSTHGTDWSVLLSWTLFFCNVAGNDKVVRKLETQMSLESKSKTPQAAREACVAGSSWLSRICRIRDVMLLTCGTNVRNRGCSSLVKHPPFCSAVLPIGQVTADYLSLVSPYSLSICWQGDKALLSLWKRNHSPLLSDRRHQGEVRAMIISATWLMCHVWEIKHN